MLEPVYKSCHLRARQDLCRSGYAADHSFTSAAVIGKCSSHALAAFSDCPKRFDSFCPPTTISALQRGEKKQPGAVEIQQEPTRAVEVDIQAWYLAKKSKRKQRRELMLSCFSCSACCRNGQLTFSFVDRHEQCGKLVNVAQTQLVQNFFFRKHDCQTFPYIFITSSSWCWHTGREHYFTNL